MTQKQPKSYTPTFENVKILRIIDADTFVIDIDLMFNTWHSDTFRLNRVNAYEKRGKEKVMGLKAKRFVEKLFKSTKKIKVQTIKQGSFKRYVCEVWVDNVNLSDLLVKLKLARYQKY